MRSAYVMTFAMTDCFSEYSDYEETDLKETDDYQKDKQGVVICESKHAIIACGYTYRLERYKSDIVDALWNLVGQGLDERDDDLCHSKDDLLDFFGRDEEDLHDGIGFKCTDIRCAFEAAEILKKYDHCYGFDYPYLIEQKGDTIILDYDTESG